MLVVDASQGIEAQTLANLYRRWTHDLAIVPVINKIDLASAARRTRWLRRFADLLGFAAEDTLRVSAKEGTNVRPGAGSDRQAGPSAPGDVEGPLRALIFDSHYDSYKGVDGLRPAGRWRVGPRQCDLRLLSNGVRVDPIEVGIFAPGMTPVKGLAAGEVGYVATGLKTVRECRGGRHPDPPRSARPRGEPLPGYRPAKPMVFAGIYPTEGEDYAVLRDALEKLQLNDAALVYEPETSEALDFGFRCGFLGLFHMEIVQERLEREYELDIIATAPSVRVPGAAQDNGENGDHLQSGRSARRGRDRRDRASRGCTFTSLLRTTYYRPGDGAGHAPARHLYGAGVPVPEAGACSHFDIPLTEMVVDFFDKLKSNDPRLCFAGL